MRLGAVDVISKSPKEIPRLKQVLLTELDRHGTIDADSGILRSVSAVLEEAVKIMLEMGRELYEDATTDSVVLQPRVLLVDDDADFLGQLRDSLDQNTCILHFETSGGAALDKASEQPFDIVAVRGQLPDLPGATVLKSIQNYHSENIGLLYSAAGEDGHLDRYQGGVPTHVERPFTGPSQLTQKLQTIINEFGHLQQERRYIRAFRRHHDGFLRRYADLKMRIDGLKDGSGSGPIQQ